MNTASPSSPSSPSAPQEVPQWAKDAASDHAHSIACALHIEAFKRPNSLLPVSDTMKIIELALLDFSRHAQPALTAAEAELAELRKDRDGSGLRNDLAITEGELKKYRDRLAFLGNPKNVFAYSVAADGQIKVGSRFDFKLFPSMEAAIDAARNQQENRE